jgi:GNAT superfamily N-acetyltransferase
MSKSVAIAAMSRPQMAFAIQLAAAEGWNPGWQDAGTFYAADAGGFLMAELEGEPAGCIFAVAYPENFGFIGLYIVVPEFRGQGIGRALWQRAMQRLQGRNIGLDGVVALQETYARSGFKTAYRNVRYSGVTFPPPDRLPPGISIVDARTLPMEDLLAYDRRFFPAPREAFLKAWLAQTGGCARALLKEGQLTGLGVLRGCQHGSKVGPLFANDEASGETLLLHLAQQAPLGGAVILDLPEVNPAARRLAESLGMEVTFETARMYTGPAPDVDLAGIYGVTTFELG